MILSQKGEYGPCKTMLGVGPAFNQPTDFKGIINDANVNAVTNLSNVAGLDSEGITDIVGGFDIFNSIQKTWIISSTGGCYTGAPLVCGPPKFISLVVVEMVPLLHRYMVSRHW